jgi:hypothetical protein
VKRRILIGAALLLALAAALAWQHQHSASGRALRLMVRGGDAGGLPLAQPADEHLDAAALALMARDPAANGLAALMIMRHGHLVYSRYGRGTTADTVIDAGAFASALLALSTGIALDERLIHSAPIVFEPEQLRSLLESASHEGYADFLGQQLWSRLNAAPAWISVPRAGAPAPVDCCFHARLVDWLRVGGLLANDGNFEDIDIVSRSWVERMRQPQPSGATGYGVALPSHRPGAPSYEASDLFLLRGPGHWRLWIVPSLRLVVLFGAADFRGAPADWDESRLPDLAIEAVTDRPAVPPGTTLLQRLVPGH